MDKKYCLGLYEKAMPGNLTMAEKLTAAREAGYDYLEMSVDETDEKLARLDMSREEKRTDTFNGKDWDADSFHVSERPSQIFSWKRRGGRAESAHHGKSN